MSREIKFRLWNQKALCMENAGDRPFTISPWGVPLYDGLMLTNRVVMQFTGLKDKNGKEIYEGDILLTKYEDGSYYDIVSWSGVYATWVFVGTDVPISARWDDLNDPEVIGNIYENSELLEVKA